MPCHEDDLARFSISISPMRYWSFRLEKQEQGVPVYKHIHTCVQSVVFDREICAKYAVCVFVNRWQQLVHGHTMSFRSRSSYTEHDILACDICLEHFDDKEHEAKFLSCHHSFCQVCLAQLKNGGEYIECPTCRHHTPLTEAGISGLQTNFYITYMRETFNKIGAPKIKGCKKHSNQPMSFFCQKCGTAICRDCTVLDHKDTDGHAIQDITVAEVEQRQGLATQVDDARKALDNLHSKMQHLEAEAGNLTVAKEITLRELEHTFEKCIKSLELRKLHLAKSIFDTYNKRQEALLKKSEDMSDGLKNLNTLISHCDKLVKTGPLGEIVTSKRSLQNMFKDMTGKVNNLNLGKNYLTFDPKTGVKHFEESVKSVGSVETEAYLPTRMTFQPKEMIAGLQSVAIVQLYSHNGELLKDYPISVVISDHSNTYIQNTIVPHAKGHYVLKFVPQISGEHKFAGAFLGQPIKGSEVTVKVSSNNPLQKFGEQGNGEGKFLSPRAVAVDTDGSIYVADTGNRLIQKLNAKGDYKRQFCINSEKQNRSTCDLALNTEKGVIVCTETMIGGGINPTMGNVVMIYDRDGNLKDVFTNKVMKCALCIATNSRGDIIVSDYLVHSLFMYDHKGTFIRRIGHSGTFNHPAFICIGEDDNIIVSDTNNDCVQIFDKDGNFLHQFGRSGSGKGELRQPFGVAADRDNILVVDSGNRRVQVFTKEGQFVSMVESTDDPLEQPRGMAVTQDGFLYIADRDNHCIKKYRYKNVWQNTDYLVNLWYAILLLFGV